MKFPRLFSAVLGCSVLLLFTQCRNDDGIDVRCENGGAVVHSVTDAEGTVSYNEDLDSFLVHYHVSGTVDEVWTGVICPNVLSSFAVADGMYIRYSGNFKDDNGDLSAYQVMGGQTVYYLELTKAEQLEIE